jgi:hypothetical protein
LTALEALESIRSNRPDKVARALEAAGCRGTPGGLDCPLAVFIKLRTGEAAFVTPDTLVIGPDYQTTPLPYWASRFVTSSDAGRYPYLERF